MNKIYLIADLHLYHEKIANFRNFSTIEEHNEFIIDSCNSVVNKKDTLLLLGDIVFGGSKNLSILNRLKGYKKLIMGNHDRYPSSEYLKYVNSIYGAVQLKGYILTHIPVHESQFSRFKGNIHGHLHGEKLNDERYTCVSVENINYKPITFEGINQ